MSVLVVGSVGLDAIQTPFGHVENSLGGSAVYFSIAARLYDQVNLVAVVGKDFPERHLEFLRRQNIGLEGLEIAEGKTFRWAGRYDYDMNTAVTLDTQLNVFAHFHPSLPETCRDSEFVFLANIAPELQLEVLAQVRRPKLTVLDTMNYWISYRKDLLTRVMSEVDIVLINEGEVRQYANTFNLVAGARQILALGPKALIVKRGEYGAVMFCRDDHLNNSFFFAPAYPLQEFKDPTGAGDSFAGGFLGYLAQHGGVGGDNLKRAIIHGSVVASFTVEGFGVDRLSRLTVDDVLHRYHEFQGFTNFEPACPLLDDCEHMRERMKGIIAK